MAVIDLLIGDYAIISIIILALIKLPSSKLIASLPLFTASAVIFLSLPLREAAYDVLWPEPHYDYGAAFAGPISILGWLAMAVVLFVLACALVVAFAVSVDKNRYSVPLLIPSKTPVKALVISSLVLVFASFAPFVFNIINKDFIIPHMDQVREYNWEVRNAEIIAKMKARGFDYSYDNSYLTNARVRMQQDKWIVLYDPEGDFFTASMSFDEQYIDLIEEGTSGISDIYDNGKNVYIIVKEVNATTLDEIEKIIAHKKQEGGVFKFDGVKLTKTSVSTDEVN